MSMPMPSKTKELLKRCWTEICVCLVLDAALGKGGGLFYKETKKIKKSILYILSGVHTLETEALI